MIDREINPENYRAPDCWYKERSGHYKSRVTYRNELSEMDEETVEAFRSYISGQLEGYGDLLTVAEASEFVGYCDTSFHRWCAEKHLKAFNISGDTSSRSFASSIFSYLHIVTASRERPGNIFF